MSRVSNLKEGEKFEKEKKGGCKENEIKLTYWVVNDFPDLVQVFCGK